MKVLMKQLKQFYIPPLSKMYFERAALEKVVFGVPLFIRISDPDSWLMESPYQKYKALSKDALQETLEHMNNYLTINKGSMFDGERPFLLNESLPYLEWHCNNEFFSSADLLGKNTLFIDLLEFEEELDALSGIVNGLQSTLNEHLQLVLLGSYQMLAHFKHYNNLICIDPNYVTDTTFIERLRQKQKNGLALFSFGSRPYFLTNADGKLLAFLNKFDQPILFEEIKKYIY